MALFIAMLVALVARQTPLALVFCALGVALSMSYRKPNAEVKKAMRNGKVQIKGSKWPFANPLTLTIKKEGIQQAVLAKEPMSGSTREPEES